MSLPMKNSSSFEKLHSSAKTKLPWTWCFVLLGLGLFLVTPISSLNSLPCCGLIPVLNNQSENFHDGPQHVPFPSSTTFETSRKAAQKLFPTRAMISTSKLTPTNSSHIREIQQEILGHLINPRNSTNNTNNSLNVSSSTDKTTNASNKIYKHLRFRNSNHHSSTKFAKWLLPENTITKDIDTGIHPANSSTLVKSIITAVSHENSMSHKIQHVQEQKVSIPKFIHFSPLSSQIQTNQQENHKPHLHSSSNTEETTSHIISTPKPSKWNDTMQTSWTLNVLQENQTEKSGFASSYGYKSRTLFRAKRDVLLLYNVISCATGCNPLTLMGYGCYCGYLGAGKAVDQIDRCCQIHDWCYDRLPCPQKMLYFIPYKWNCHRGKPQCYGAKKTWNHRSNCNYRMCECDRLLGECLRRQPCPKKKSSCPSAPLKALQNIIFNVGIGG